MRFEAHALTTNFIVAHEVRFMSHKTRCRYPVSHKPPSTVGNAVG